MPYIKDGDRKKFRSGIDKIKSKQPNEGELNFVLTSLLKDFVERLGGRYGAHNSAIGILECCKLELYRQLTAPYEDEKRRENGDV